MLQVSASATRSKFYYHSKARLPQVSASATKNKFISAVLPHWCRYQHLQPAPNLNVFAMTPPQCICPNASHDVRNFFLGTFKFFQRRFRVFCHRALPPGPLLKYKTKKNFARTYPAEGIFFTVFFSLSLFILRKFCKGSART